MNLTWGLRGVIPDDAVAAWGARAILRNGALDILPDRTDQRGIRAHPKFMGWTAGTGLDWLKEVAKKARGHLDEVFALDEGPFHIRANTNASHGYLYISAWAADNQGEDE